MSILDINKNGIFDQKDLQLWFAIVFALTGIFLLLAAFFFPPTASIDTSVITACGELFTFCATLLGIDYHYSYLIAKTLKVKSEEQEEKTGL